MKMSEMKNFIGKYVGRKLDKEGESWKKYKLTFQVDDKELNFGAFMPWEKKDGTPKKGTTPNNLEEGKWYKIGYTEYHGEKDGKPYVSKTAVSMFESDEPKGNQLDNQPQQKPEPNGLRLPTEIELTEILNKYNTAVDPNVKSLNHFVGTVLLTLNPDQLQYVKDKYN